MNRRYCLAFLLLADALTELRVRLPRARDGKPARPWQPVQVRRLVALARRTSEASIAPPLEPMLQPAKKVHVVQPKTRTLGQTPEAVRAV